MSERCPEERLHASRRCWQAALHSAAAGPASGPGGELSPLLLLPPPCSGFAAQGTANAEGVELPQADSPWLRPFPVALRHLLVWLHERYDGAPIIITENGVSAPGELSLAGLAGWPVGRLA